MKLLKYTLFFTISLMTFSAQAELKAAFINSAVVLQKAPQAIAASEAMKKEFEAREQELRNKAEKIKKQESDLLKDGAIMSADQQAKAQKEINEQKRQLTFDAQSLKEDVDLRRKQEIQKLRTSISSVIRSYSEKNGYDLVFTEGVAFAADKVDITDEILKELSK